MELLDRATRRLYEIGRVYLAISAVVYVNDVKLVFSTLAAYARLSKPSKGAARAGPDP